MNSSTVLGLQFGDEGKGRTVDWLCQQKATRPDLVVRFSGGQQAGHHVMFENQFDHVFANFGSGSYQGVPTYLAPTCTVDPIGIMNELDVLAVKDVVPTLYIDGKCPITTPLEVAYNQRDEANMADGSCGCGIGATWEREKNYYSLLFEDLFFPSILSNKLALIADRYPIKLELSEFDNFIEQCIKITHAEEIIQKVHGIPKEFESKILYEGSQGLLLDKKHGFFPHVTYSHTDTTNIKDPGDIYLVTRAYQTRHGNGPMTNENLKQSILQNPYEQNFHDGFQGLFRRTILDVDLLIYAIMKDPVIRNAENKTLVVTCLDLIDGHYDYTYKGDLFHCKTKKEFINTLQIMLTMPIALVSNSAFGDIETFNY